MAGSGIKDTTTENKELSYATKYPSVLGWNTGGKKLEQIKLLLEGIRAVAKLENE